MAFFNGSFFCCCKTTQHNKQQRSSQLHYLHNCTSSTLKSLATGGTPVLQFWRLHGHSYPNLKVVALRVFSVTASSAASERNFSMMGFIHSKLRNALGAEKVEKLVYIKTNYPQLPKHDGAFWEDDAEEEESSGDGQETGEMEV